jgi:glycosyltransferase involved in cell wall biosynthesis
MKKRYDISIIVCCYSGEETIEACLESLMNQERDNISIEVILVDDGSKDGTSKKISNFLESNSILNNLHFKYFRKENEGLSIARNYGISKSRSDIVAFIDEDAVADLNFSKNIIQLFIENKKVNCIGGKVELLNIDNSFANIIQKSIFSFQMKSKYSVIGTNMAFRKSLFTDVGGFQPEFTYRGDESALFAKAKGKIFIMKSDNVIVKHPQPPTLYKWLKTRYENGYFGAAVNELVNKENITNFKHLTYSLLLLFLPIFVISC